MHNNDFFSYVFILAAILAFSTFYQKINKWINK